jgi:hypothetical protein
MAPLNLHITPCLGYLGIMTEIGYQKVYRSLLGIHSSHAMNVGC